MDGSSNNNNNSRWHVRSDACHGHSVGLNNNNNHHNGFRETVRSDHHSEEQTFFCGVKEVYSVTTEKVEKWGSESREWLEKTTSHRIQHQHPHPHADAHAPRQYSLSNRINVANNNPILIASEILEIPPDQRIRPGAFGQSASRPPEGDFCLPSIRATGKNQAAARHQAPEAAEVPEAAPDMPTAAGPAHVRFIEENPWSGGRARSIVADLVGSEPAEIQVAVPRYPAVPRSRSMVVNTSSGEEDEGDDRDDRDAVDDDSDECLSCADSLESERSPRSAPRHDDKPVRGHVVLAERKPPPQPQPRLQSPKSFFVSLAEEHASEEDVPVSARLPDELREKLLHRHTMVKLQMAQHRRFLRTACDAAGSATTATRRRHHAARGATVRVGVSHGKDSKVTVSVERRGDDKDAVKKDRPARPKRDAVAPVVRVHKCHVHEEVKASFKAKPYKLARINESTNEDAADEAKKGKQARHEARPDRAKPHARATVRARHKDADKQAEAKERGERKERPKNGDKARDRSTEVRADAAGKQAKEAKREHRVAVNVKQSRNAAEAKKTHSHVAHKNLANAQRSSDARKDEVIADLARVARDQPDDDDRHHHHHQRREHASKERTRSKAVRHEHAAKASTQNGLAASSKAKHSGEKESAARGEPRPPAAHKGDAAQTATRVRDQSEDQRRTEKETKVAVVKKQAPCEHAAEQTAKAHREDAERGAKTVKVVKVVQGREQADVCAHAEHSQQTVRVVRVSREPEDAGTCGCANGDVRIVRVSRTQPDDSGGCCHRDNEAVRLTTVLPDAEGCAGCSHSDQEQQTVKVVRVLQEPEDPGGCGHEDRDEQTVRVVRVLRDAEESRTCEHADQEEQAVKVVRVLRDAEESRACEHADHEEQTVRVVRVLQEPEENGNCSEAEQNTIKIVKVAHDAADAATCDHSEHNDRTVTVTRTTQETEDSGVCDRSEHDGTAINITAVSRDPEDSACCDHSEHGNDIVRVTRVCSDTTDSELRDEASRSTVRVTSRTTAPEGRAAHTIATQVSEGDMAAGADVHTQTTPRPPPRPTPRMTARTEVRSHVTTQQTTRTETCSETKRVSTKEVQRRDGEDGTRVHTSVTTTMQTKDTGTQAGEDGGKLLEIETTILHDVAQDGGGGRAQDAADEGTLSPVGSRGGTSRASAGSPGPRRSGSGLRFQQRFEPIPEESRNGGDDAKRAELTRAHSSSKARAALQQHAEDENADVLAMSKGWINFYLMKEHGDGEDGVTEDAAPVERMEYSMEIRAMPEAAATPRGPVSAATSPLCLAAATTTTTATSPIPSTRLRDADAAVCTADRAVAPADRPRPRDPPAAIKAPPAARAANPKPAAPKAAAKPLAKGKAYRARGVGTTDHEDASTNTMCGPTLPVHAPGAVRWGREPEAALQDAATSTLCGPTLPHHQLDASTGMCPPVLGHDAVDTMPPPPHSPPDAAASALCGPIGPMGAMGAMLPMGLAGPFSEAGVSACTHHTTMMSMSRRTVVTRRERLPFAHVGDLSDAMSTSSDSTEYMAPPARSITDGDSTCSPCWRRAPRGGVPGPRGAAARGLRGRAQGLQGPQGAQAAAPGLYQHHVPPRAQPAGPPPRDGVGWTVTVAGAGANQQGDLEMRLSFPTAEDAKDGLQSGRQGHAEAGKRRQAGQGRSHAANMSAPPPGRWSLTIRNQLPGDGDPSQRGVSVSMTPATPQENRPNDTKLRAVRAGRAATSDKSRRPLSLIWPRLHQEINSVAAHEVSEAETVLSVTGAAIQRRSRLLAHRR